MMLGLEAFLERSQVGKICLITNATGVNHEITYNYHLLLRKGFKINKIFTPEQGLFGTAMDGEKLNNSIYNGIPIISLYGDRLYPSDKDLEDCELVIYDMEDAGVRCFTLISTLKLAMEAAKNNNKKFIVLDRPNPLGTSIIKGPGIKKDNLSFVGIENIPIRYGLTPGETALYFNRSINTDLEVIKMEGYDGSKYHDEILNFYIPLSLHLPSFDSVYNYQAMCLLEGTNISVGRGTTSPFMQFGAPFMENFNLRIPGIKLRKTYFRPTYSLYKDESIPGYYIHIMDRRSYNPFFLVIEIMKYGIEKGMIIDQIKISRLYGSLDLIKQISNGIPTQEIIDQWNEFENKFKRLIAGYRLY